MILLKINVFLIKKCNKDKNIKINIKKYNMKKGKAQKIKKSRLKKNFFKNGLLYSWLMFIDFLTKNFYFSSEKSVKIVDFY